MTPREKKHELVALREGLKGIGERLGELYREVEWEERKSKEVVCPRCKRVAENEEVFQDESFRTTLKVGDKSTRLAPIESAIMEVLLTKVGEIVTWNKVLFDVYESVGYRPWMRNTGTKYQMEAIRMALVRLRKKLKGLPVSVNTVWGVGLILVVEKGIEVRLE